MAKKERIPIRREGDLEAIDLELDEALGRLEGANEKIVNLLQSIETSNVADETTIYAEEGGEEDVAGEGPAEPGPDAPDAALPG